MTKKNEKGLRPWLVRSVAVFMGICYLMAPLQQEVTELMHLLSHSIDPGIGHHSIASHTHDFHDHDRQDKAQDGTSTYSTEAHEHKGANEIALHGHPHPHNSESHSHEIIDFMSMAFSASTPTHHENDKIKLQSDLDKHLVVYTNSHIQTIPAFVKTYFSNLKENTSKGIQFLIVPPPKPFC